jgi:hypothetical protein
MIIYNQAFDLYHCIFRILHLLNKFEKQNIIEVDRIRIWDFYLLYPQKVHDIRLLRTEADIKKLRNSYVHKDKNPYDAIVESRKFFEKLHPYQLAALNCIASYGIIEKDALQFERVIIQNKNILESYVQQVQLSRTQQNAISLLTGHFSQISLFGKDGLKARTDLMVSKYDAQ